MKFKKEKNISKLNLLKIKFDVNNLPPGMSVKDYLNQLNRLESNLKN